MLPHQIRQKTELADTCRLLTEQQQTQGLGIPKDDNNCYITLKNNLIYNNIIVCIRSFSQLTSDLL